MDWQLSVANAATQPLFQQLVRLPPDRRDPGAIARHTQEAVAAMSLLDRALPGDGLLLGSDLTAADIAVGVTLHRYMSLDIARPYLASLARYYHGLASRPAFATFVAIGKP
jgi:glutathione S-transferase